MKKTIVIRVRTMVMVLATLLTGAVAVAALQSAGSEDVDTKTLHRLAYEGTPGFPPQWEMQTRLYTTAREAGDSWDAYILNTQTGELYFVNQATMTRVKEGQARGAK